MLLSILYCIIEIVTIVNDNYLYNHVLLNLPNCKSLIIYIYIYLYIIINRTLMICNLVNLL